jgi:hypothetical protein
MTIVGAVAIVSPLKLVLCKQFCSGGCMNLVMNLRLN